MNTNEQEHVYPETVLEYTDNDIEYLGVMILPVPNCDTCPYRAQCDATIGDCIAYGKLPLDMNIPREEVPEYDANGYGIGHDGTIWDLVATP